MKINRHLLASICIGIFLSTIGPQATAQSAEGYETVDPPIATNSPGKIVVVEFFSYGCPHCFALDPELHSWEQNLPSDVLFSREAPPLNKFWRFRSQAFYAAETLDLTEELHQAYFKAVHEEGRKLKKRESILEFVAELGIDQQTFATAMESAEVQLRMEQALAQVKEADITGVPTILVNGKYKTGTRIAGEGHAVVDVIQTLVEQERQSLRH